MLCLAILKEEGSSSRVKCSASTKRGGVSFCSVLRRGSSRAGLAMSLLTYWKWCMAEA